MNIENKRVSDAVKSLILSHPLFAGILLQQTFVADSSPENPTFSVDGETFRYNPTFADSLSFDECKAVCAHEAMHLALLHHVRQGSRDAKDWNKATDYAINGELTKQGFKLPKGALLDARFTGKSAEDVYKTLASEKPKPQPKQDQGKQNSQQGNGKPDPSGNGQGQSAQGQPDPNGQPNGAPSDGDPSDGNPCGNVKPSKGDAKGAEAKAKTQVEKAVSIAKLAGGLSADTERVIKSALAPRYDWREVLHRFFQDFTRSDYSFAQPNKRFISRGLILPSLYSRAIGRIVLAVDTSGSISVEEVSAMVSEIHSCMESYTEEGVTEGLTVIYCDAEVKRVETLFVGDEPKPLGGGGTRFSPVFEHLQDDLGGAACLVYLTDGENSSSDSNAFENLNPSFPVLWGLIRDNDKFAPHFGETVRFDVHAN